MRFRTSCDILYMEKFENMKRLIGILLLTAFVYGKDKSVCDSVYTLRPGTELRNLMESIPGDVYARVVGAEVDVSYEIVLSYPASRPAEYVIKTIDKTTSIIKDCDFNHGISSEMKGTFRRLLDTEKIRVEGTDTAALYVHIQILPSIVRPHINELKVAKFNLRVEELSFGIPSRALSLVAFCLVGLAFTLTFLTPRVVRFLITSTTKEAELVTTTKDK